MYCERPTQGHLDTAAAPYILPRQFLRAPAASLAPADALSSRGLTDVLGLVGLPLGQVHEAGKHLLRQAGVLAEERVGHFGGVVELLWRVQGWGGI